MLVLRKNHCNAEPNSLKFDRILTAASNTDESATHAQRRHIPLTTFRNSYNLVF